MSVAMTKYAHSNPADPDQQTWEVLAAHLTLVGDLAGRFADAFGWRCGGLVAGLLHDIGKCSAAYQSYIARPAQSGGPKGPDHSSAGAREVMALYPQIGRVIAFAIAGHHTGLMDGSGGDGRGSSLADRLVKPLEPYDDWRAHVRGLPKSGDMMAQLIRPKPNGIAPGFEKAFLIRMVHSCLVDADFLATEQFYAHVDGTGPPARGGQIGQRHLDAIRAHMARHRRDDTPVNQLRSQILDHANARADLLPGLFTLTVPTGGGKTLTSLSFALEHALAHDLRRIVYVIPFTSIIEQTAQIFRNVPGMTEGDILEHHSSFDWNRTQPGTGNDEESEGAAGLAKLRRDAENWDAPIVVTTAAQFFESLFAARTSKTRKLHNLAQSVVILDEAQAIPTHLLRPCMAAIDELARNYGASVVLCTATQPALRLVDGALPMTKKGAAEGLDIPDTRELAPNPTALYTQLKRVKVEWRRDPVCDAHIAARFAQTPQMLCIVNSRAHAQDLFALLREQEQPGALHLTTLMCARHRRDVLAKVRDDLVERRPVRLVSTSLIEAGVDVDFPEVWRAATGLSSIAQAAGRCNREGKGPNLGRTVVFVPADHKVPPAINSFYQAARGVLRNIAIDPLGLAAILEYHQELYFRQGYDALDAATFDGAKFPIIRDMAAWGHKLDIPFSRIADAFRMIDDVMDPVIVPWDDEARAAIDVIVHADFPPAGVQRRLQQYTVPVPSRVRGAMLARGAVHTIRPEKYGDRFVVLQNTALYDPALGLSLDDPSYRSSESNIFA